MQKQIGKEGRKKGDGETENASNILRRLSSPIFSAGGFNGEEDADNNKVFFFSEKKDAEAEKIQRWWRNCQKASKRTKAVLAARPAFVRIQQLLDKVI